MQAYSPCGPHFLASSGPRRIWLLCLWAGLCTAGILPWVVRLDRPTAGTTKTRSRVLAQSTSGLGAGPTTSFEDLIRRPLFIEGRRPSAPPKSAPVFKFVAAPAAPFTPPPSIGEYARIGVAVSPLRREALIRLVSSQAHTTVSIGDRLGPWTVKSIGPTSVSLQCESRIVELVMSARQNGMSPSPPNGQPMPPPVFRPAPTNQ